ncbi:hypothetical protein G5I_09365 [Acromyrmex echinatior]|uniref:Uncharacterized protein n=1 Tax=Acromyrmex echinatior TaxID=103372 RepID=F4WU11_ACREC|nr:hypothetical protein G5I_09365 [Acromyrmex echinatior]
MQRFATTCAVQRYTPLFPTGSYNCLPSFSGARCPGESNVVSDSTLPDVFNGDREIEIRETAHRKRATEEEVSVSPQERFEGWKPMSTAGTAGRVGNLTTIRVHEYEECITGTVALVTVNSFAKQALLKCDYSDKSRWKSRIQNRRRLSAGIRNYAEIRSGRPESSSTVSYAVGADR